MRIAKRLGQIVGSEPDHAERILLFARDRIDQRNDACRRRRSRLSCCRSGCQLGTSLTGPLTAECDAAPGEHDDAHDRRGDHDLQRLVARLVDAEQVLVQEVNRDRAGDRHGAPVLDQPGASTRRCPEPNKCVSRFQDQADDVLPGRHAADRPGEHVVEHQRRDGQLGQEAAHRFLDDRGRRRRARTARSSRCRPPARRS